MKKHTNSNKSERTSPGPQYRNFVYFLMAVAALWTTLVFATEGYAAIGTVKQVGEIADNLHLEDSNPGTILEFQALEQPALSSQLSNCCEQTEGHKQMNGSCQSSCPAAGGALPVNRAWLLPAHVLRTTKFVPFLVAAPDSLLHQRLNRPPIAGC
jgi:hypothetical protein